MLSQDGVFRIDRLESLLTEVIFILPYMILYLIYLFVYQSNMLVSSWGSFLVERTTIGCMLTPTDHTLV